jgi:hypothetical protein
MEVDEYDAQLRRLGLHGPMGELRLDSGKFVLVYKMPDGSHRYLAPPSSMTPEMRSDQIEALRQHLEALGAGRRSDEPQH